MLPSPGLNQPYTDRGQTSALDTHTEQQLLQNINSILKEKARTSVFIAHRLRTIYDSDRIIVLQGGQVAESGSHAQLLLSGGVYSELWNGMELRSLGRTFISLTIDGQHKKHSWKVAKKLKMDGMKIEMDKCL